MQDTGFDAVLPTRAGLLGSRTVDEAVAALGEVAGDALRHRAAALAIARGFFDSDVVLAPAARGASDVTGARIGDDVFISREVVIADGSSAVPLRLGPIHPVPALGAGAAVTSDVAPGTVEAGDAAQVVRTRPWRA